MNYLDEYYNNYNEEERLLSRHGQVEYLTTMKYIRECLGETAEPNILEVGAGTGRYSVTLAKEGYRVTAVELIQHNLEVLKAKLDGTEPIRALQGNALDLSFLPDGAYDLTMVLGPMYHLYTREDKVRALAEAMRVTKPGGYILTAYCMNEGSVIGFMFRGNNLRYWTGTWLHRTGTAPAIRRNCSTSCARRISLRWTPSFRRNGSSWSRRTARRTTCGKRSTRWTTKPLPNGWSTILRSANART